MRKLEKHVPELRASRLKLIARLVAEEFGGDLRRVLDGSKEVRKALKRFPTIGDPGVEKILLFCAGVPTAAVPSAERRGPRSARVVTFRASQCSSA